MYLKPQYSSLSQGSAPFAGAHVLSRTSDGLPIASRIEDDASIVARSK